MKTLFLLNPKTSSSLLGLFCFLLLSYTQAYAQGAEGHIEGRVTDKSGTPLDYATLTLISFPDSAVLKTFFTGEDGRFDVRYAKKGKFLLKAELLGYSPGYSETFELSELQSQVKLGDLALETANKELQAIVITAEKPLIERKADMLVVNVENSTLAAGNNALDILERSPGITVDKDDNISLNGKQGILVTIDGKQTHLSSTQLANLLRSTDGNTIQSVEIINNPSSKYDAAGGSGIINIKMKKNRMAGTSGSVTLGGGYGNGHKANGSLNLNHKANKLNVFGTYSYMDNERTDQLNIFRLVGANTSFTSFTQDNVMNAQRASHSMRAGVDYQTSAKNTVSFQVSGLLNNSNDSNLSDVNIGSFGSALDSTLAANSLFDEDFKSYSVAVNNTYLIDTIGTKISADIDFSSFFEKGGANYENRFFNVDGSAMRNPLFLKSDMPSTIHIQSYKTDLTRPFSDKSGMEAGLKYANVKTDNDLKFSEMIDGQWTNVADRTNHFVYTEQVAAAYVNYHTKFNKFGVQAGLRSEYTVSNGNSITLDNEVKRDYIDFFPNVSVSYDASENHQYSVSYSKRVNRPRYNNLNPFSYFLDKYTYQQGNPYLQPEYTHAIGLNYTLMKRFNFAAGYEITKDAVVEMMKQNDVEKSTLVTNENIAEQEQWFLNVNAPVTFTSFWKSNTNVTGFYLGFKADRPEANINYGQYALQLNSNHSFTILPTLSAEATLNYQSGLRYSIYKIGSAWSTDLGISKSLKDKRANVKLSVSDIFNTRTQHVSTQYSNLNATIDQKRETRVFRLSFSYNFGNTKLSGPRQATKSEEQKRVGDN